MITSAANRGWPGDISIANLSTAGLPAPSVIRTAKIATIETNDAVKLGRISTPALKKALDAVATALALNRNHLVS